jgi:hypothetical protein
VTGFCGNQWAEGVENDSFVHSGRVCFSVALADAPKGEVAPCYPFHLASVQLAFSNVSLDLLRA